MEKYRDKIAKEIKSQRGYYRIDCEDFSRFLLRFKASETASHKDNLDEVFKIIDEELQKFYHPGEVNRHSHSEYYQPDLLIFDT